MKHTCFLAFTFTHLHNDNTEKAFHFQSHFNGNKNYSRNDYMPLFPELVWL